MQNHQYFVTGFPGFIASRLIRRLLSFEPQARIDLLVHPSQQSPAERSLATFPTTDRARLTLLSGDITKPDLGLSAEQAAAAKKTVTHVFHLAALYDLAVPEAVAKRVNIDGTMNLNRFVEAIASLERYVYFSTAFVSGCRTGRILETELDDGQTFKNHYESTKFAAEKLVRGLAPRVPVVIVRPGIVVGDTGTGETAKFDGPYFVMGFMNRFSILPLPYIGHSTAILNLTPVNYVVDATVQLAHSATAAGQTFHLVDPNPHSISEVYELIHQTMFKKRPFWTVPIGVVALALRIGPVRKLFGVPAELMDYFNFHAEHDCTQAIRELKEKGITCPDLSSYIGRLVGYFHAHRNDPEKVVRVV